MDGLKGLSPKAQKGRLTGLSRSQLQKLAKEAGLKANVKSVEIVESLLKALSLESGLSAVAQQAKPVVGKEQEEQMDTAKEGLGNQASSANKEDHRAAHKKASRSPSGKDAAVPASPEKAGTSLRKKRRATGEEDDPIMLTAKRLRTAQKRALPPTLSPLKKPAETASSKGPQTGISPINPASSPKKLKNFQAADSAPSCKTVLLPALDSSKEKPKAALPAADQPVSEDEAVKMDFETPSGRVSNAHPVAFESESGGKAEPSPSHQQPVKAECSRASRQPKSPADTAQDERQPAAKVEGFGDEFKQTKQNDFEGNSTARISEEKAIGPICSEASQQVEVAADASAKNQLLVALSNPLAERDSVDSAPGKFPEVIKEDGAMMEELDNVERMIFGGEEVPEIQKASLPGATPPGVFETLMGSTAEHKTANPGWVCNNPMFEDSAMEDGTETCPPEASGRISDVHTALLEKPLLTGRQSSSRQSRKEQAAFERGRKSGIWLGAKQCQLGQLEEEWQSYKSESVRGWTLPSLADVQAESQSLAASGYTTVSTPNKRKPPRSSLRQGVKRKASGPSEAAAAGQANLRTGTRVSSARLIPKLGTKENASTPSRLSKQTVKTAGTPLAGSKLAGRAPILDGRSPGVTERAKLATPQPNRAQVAEAKFAARRKLAAQAVARK